MAGSYQRQLERERRRTEREAALRAKHAERASAEHLVREYEKTIRHITSLHQVSPPPIKWVELAAELEPIEPVATNAAERRAHRIKVAFEHLGGHQDANISMGRELDSQTNQHNQNLYKEELNAFRKASTLARRVLAGESEAYQQALAENDSLNDLIAYGDDITFAITSPDLIACSFTAHDTNTIPRETVSLTSSGKLSTRPMSRTAFMELYQDHIASCILRIAIEVFACVPTKAIIITAYAEMRDAQERQQGIEPVVSTIIHRGQHGFRIQDGADPSDTLENLGCRSNFKATRKAGAFQPIKPFTSEDVKVSPAFASYLQTRRLAQILRDELE